MLTENNRKGELSYACLRTLAAEAGFACSGAGRHLGGAGVNARIEITQRLDAQSLLTQFALDFHVQATSRKLTAARSKIAFSLEVGHYDHLRDLTGGLPRFVVLLALPEEPESWLTVSAEELIARRSARWLCLHGAPVAAGTSETAVYFPTWNVLTPAALREIARRVSLGGRFFHEQ